MKSNADASEKRMERLKRAGGRAAWLLAVITTPVFVVVDAFVPDGATIGVKTIGYGFIVISTIALISFQRVNMAKMEELQDRLDDGRRRDERAASVLSHVTRLCDRKADRLRDSSYDLTVSEREWPFFYSVHQYLREACGEMASVVAEVIDVEIGKVDVSLIYRYVGAGEKWKWIAGRSGLSGADELESFVNKPGTLYNNMVEGNCGNPIFCNDKTGTDVYLVGRRDRLFNGQGSFFAMMLQYANNERALVEAVLLVSTYGANFVPLGSDANEVDKFRVALSHEIVPPFVSIIQAELGELYARHNLDDANFISITGKFERDA